MFRPTLYPNGVNFLHEPRTGSVKSKQRIQLLTRAFLVLVAHFMGGDTPSVGNV